MAILLARFYLPLSRSISSSLFHSIHYKSTPIYDTCIDLIHICPSTPHILQLHSHLTTQGIFGLCSSKLFKRICELGDITYAVSFLKCMDSPRIFSANNVLKACSVGAAPKMAVPFYFEIVGCGLFHPNSFTFVFLINSCSKMGCLTSAMKSHGQAIKHGVCTALPVQNSLIHMYGCYGLKEIARKVFDEMNVKDIVSWNSILHCYTNSGELTIAHELFDNMPERNVISWNVVISGYLKGNNPGCSLMLFRKMILAKIQWNERTITMVISACGRSNRLKDGRSVHGVALRSSSVGNPVVSTSLIDMYSKCGKLGFAEVIFKRMRNKTLATWNAMILGHCIHGSPDIGLKLFEMMALEQYPDEITYIGVLCGCCRMKMVEEGKRLFDEMKSKYGLKPSFAHWWCMANIYAASGMMEDAEHHMRASSSNFQMGDVLVRCRFSGDVHAAEEAALYFWTADHSNFDYYIFLANVYAAAGKWEEVTKLKEILKRSGNRRTPGLGLRDLNNIVHYCNTRLPNH